MTREVSKERRVLLQLAMAGSAGMLGGCAPFLSKKPQPVCPESPDLSYPAGRLTIDVHCHVFNGTDLPVKDFLYRILAKQSGPVGEAVRIAGDILQRLAWSVAPGYAEEDRQLAALEPGIAACGRSAPGPEPLAGMRQNAYAAGRRELRRALQASPVFASYLQRFHDKSVPADAGEEDLARYDLVGIIESLPERLPVAESVSGGPKALERSFVTRSRRGSSLVGLVLFVLQNFQYRYVSVHDYLATYNQRGTRTVDLMLPSMVDYDYWISRGKGTPTSLRQQVLLMEKISVLTRGRVHSFVPFDPLRQVAHDLGQDAAGEEPMALVMEAVERRGCVGVKLYPPMGFAALGNALVQQEHGPHFWRRDWLPPWTDRADMGQLLDRAMRRLLAWCAEHQVPIMAHTAPSNGPIADFEELASARYWELALADYPALRVNFGHFGDTSPIEHGTARAESFLRLMNGPGRPGEFAYADAAFFAEVIEREPGMLDALRGLYDATSVGARIPLAQRLLYGTDWEMTLSNWPVDNYLKQFLKLMEEMETRPALRARGLTGVSDKFFGENAVRYLGLHRDSPARTRLDRFYGAHGVGTPDWAKKVDTLRS
jgi:predicted TIM-barrel fold metal-dependent hydrolase